MLYMFISCFAFLMVIAVAFFIKPKIKNEDTKLYSVIIVTNIAGIIIDIIQYVVIRENYNIHFSNVLGKLYLIYVFFWTYLLSIYTINISKNKKEDTSGSNIYIYNIIILVLLVIGSLAVIIAPIEIVHEGSSIYSRGLACTAAYVVVSVYILIDILGTIMNISTVKNKKKYIPFLVFLGIGAISTVIQAIHPEMLLITPVESLITVLTYFFIENPDVKMLENMTILRDRADKANNAKSEFLSNMSHEIRTPLNAIVGFSESLKDDELPKESMEKVEDIIMASNNLLEIVNGILDISKIEANKLEIIEKEYEIEEIWNELIILTKARIGDRGIDFRVSIDPTIPKVLYGDNTRLKQVVLNILTNAAKYTKEGFVDFRVSSVIKNNMVKLIISVEDSGIGIKEENLPRLFSKFDRLSVEKSFTIEGTGLGLAITKKLVELMGGRIVVQSVYGKGSKFTIIIDQKIVSYEVQHQKETTESNTKAVDIKGAKVLLVDDNALNIKVATTLLKKYNLNIDSCTNGLECLEKINNGNKYDIVLLDDMMPKMSGKETLAKLKQINGFNIPVIALTANAIEGMKEEYLNLGFNDYLSKPIEKKELERVLRTYLAKRQINSTNTTNSTSATSILSSQITSDNPIKEDELDLPTLKGNENSEEPVQTHGKILVVDDNELNIKVAVKLLEKIVNSVESVTSGSDCIAKVVEGNDYDLILMDDMMPDLDGPSTLDNLRDIDGFNVPVILLTASELDSSIEDKIANHHFAGYLSKPINKEELIKVLTKFIK